MQAEAAFRNAVPRILQSRTKFDHVVQKILISVCGLIMNSTDSSTPFEDLKSKLVSSYALTDWQQANKILHHPVLGDCRPTALMDVMLALLPEDEVPSKIFLGLFLERLLVTQDFKSPNDMALHADKLWDARKVNQD